MTADNRPALTPSETAGRENPCDWCECGKTLGEHGVLTTDHFFRAAPSPVSPSPAVGEPPQEQNQDEG